MALTKTGNFLNAAMQGLKALKPVVTRDIKNSLSPLGLGFSAMDFASGDTNIGGALNGSAGGAIGNTLGSTLASKLAPRLGSIGRFVGGMALSMPGYFAGKAVGERLTSGTLRRGVPPIKNNLGLPPGAVPPKITPGMNDFT